MTKTPLLSKSTLTLLLTTAIWATSAHADLIYTGDVLPTPPSSWTSTTAATIGNTTDGALSISGENLNAASLSVGSEATGSLTLDNAASLTVSGITSLNNPTYTQFYTETPYLVWHTMDTKGSALLNFGSNSGTLNTQSLYASPSQFTGTGTINTRGILSDVDLILNSPSSLTQTLNWNNASQNVTLNLDLSGTSGTVGNLGVGYQGSGSLTLTNGVHVTTGDGFLGYKPGSTGTATITGTGTTWSPSSLTVGYLGTGIMNIFNGGQVKTGYAYIGQSSTTLCTVNVKDSGSALWINSELFIGPESGSQGLLKISNGGQATVSTVTYLGFSGNTNAHLSVSDTGSKFTSVSDLIIGVFCGTGYLDITNGATVTSKGTHLALYNTNPTTTPSVINVDGPGSTLTTSVGSSFSSNALDISASGPYPDSNGKIIYSHGQINITNGGKIYSNGPTTLGRSGAPISESMATLKIDGTGSALISTGAFYLNGSILLTNGGQLTTSQSTVAGTANISGTDTIWNTSGKFSAVGNFNIANHATIRNGIAYVGTGNFTLTNASLINSGDFHLFVNDYTYGYTYNSILTATNGSYISNTIGYIGGYISYYPHTNIATISDSGTIWNNSQELYVGYRDCGILNITNGATVTNTTGYIGYDKDPSISDYIGIANITGPGSTWTNNGVLYVGYGRAGFLNITNGAKVTSTSGSVGYLNSDIINSGVNISGLGSSWTMTGSLYLQGNASRTNTINIFNGGKITASALTLTSSSSFLSLNVANNTALDLGTGSLTNNGKIRIIANAYLKAGTSYHPITANTWSGTGTVQAVGGTWDASTHTFTTSPILQITGYNSTIDTTTTQRIKIGNTFGASFLSHSTSGNITFYADSLVSPLQSSLLSAAAPNSSILSGWMIYASGPGYTTGDPIYLSLTLADFCDGLPPNLTVWQYNDATSKWATITPDDYYTSDCSAYFTITTLGSYAITSTVPEPASLSLLLLATPLLLRRRS